MPFRFPPASASFILEQFAQYGTILKHVVSGALQVVMVDLVDVPGMF